MLRIYLMLKGQYLKTAMEYTFNFWMMFAAGVLMRTLMMGVAFVLFQNMPTIAGFGDGEVYLMMALMFISEGMCNLLFDGIWHVPALVHSGQFDVMLVRPVSPLYQVLSYELGLQGVGVMAMGLVSLTLSVHRICMTTPMTALLLILFIACGTVLRMSTYLIGVCNVFYMNAGGTQSVVFTMYSIGEYAKYPISIYPGWMQALLLGAIPFAFIGYVPLMILRGDRATGWGLALALMTIGYFLLARAVFNHGIKRYESMGM